MPFTISFSDRFEIYNGAGDNRIIPGMPDLGACANVVVRLSQSIPDMQNYIMYFDNFYLHLTSLQLLVYLRSRGIYALGTVRANRIPNCKLPDKKALKNKPRGYATEYVGHVKGVSVSIVAWKDNKTVRLASTYVGILPFIRTNDEAQIGKIPRYDKAEKAYVDIDCPHVIKEYNRHMGGLI